MNILGMLDEIVVELWDPIDLRVRGDQRIENGCHVKVRSRPDNNKRWIRVMTYRHCNCFQAQRSRLPGTENDIVYIKFG